MSDAKQNLLTGLGVAAAEAAVEPGEIPTCIVVGEPAVAIFGLAGDERLRRALTRAGVTDVRTGSGSLEDLGASVVLLRADYVFEELLFADLLTQRAIALFAEGDPAPAALHVPADQAARALQALQEGEVPAELACTRHTPSSLSGAYNKQLRKRTAPYLRKATPELRGELEKIIFAGSYKGVTDIVSKFLWPLPARHVTAWASRLGLTPNMVTTVGLVLTLVTIWLFWTGQFAAGLVTGWLMTFLDTVDGKLARVTMTSSRFGNIFDHSIDLIHPPFWYWAWLHGLGPEFGARPEAQLVLGIIVVGYVAQRLQEAFFIGAFGLEMHIWRRFDSYFRTIIARRNPNMLILTVALLFGAPALGIELVALWTALCFAVHMVQIIQAGIAKSRGIAMHSWMADR